MELTDPADWSADAWTMRVLWNRAQEGPEALRDLIPFVLAAGEASSTQGARAVADASGYAPSIAVQRRDELVAIADGMVASLVDAVPGLDFDAVEAETADVDLLTQYTDPLAFIGPMLSRGLAPIDFMSMASSMTTTDEAQYFTTYLEAATRSRKPTDTLLRALFTTTMASIEPLLAWVLPRLLLARHPDRYDSLADESLIRKVEQGARNPVEWRKAFRREGLGHVDSIVDWDALDVAWQHRNDLHHRAGFTAPTKAIAEDLPLNSSAAITVDYLQATIDRIEVAGLTFVMATAFELVPTDAAHLMYVTSGRFTPLHREGRYDLAIGVAELGRIAPSDVEEDARRQVEAWLSRGARDGAASVEAEVTDWEVEALPPIFSVARLVLLGRLEEAAAELEPVRSAGDAPDEWLRSSAIIDPLRESGLLDLGG